MTLDTMKEAVNAELRRYVEMITEPGQTRNMYVCPICGSGTGPSHSAAFTVGEQEGRPLWYCHSPKCKQGGDAIKLYQILNPGTDFKGAVQGLGRLLGFGELDTKKQRGNVIEKRVHVYQTADGQIFGRKIIVKYENADSKQRAPRWERYDPETRGWSKGLGGAKAPLYHLPELIHAAQDAPLWIVEGEKDADTMTRLGFICTSVPNGAGSHWRPEDTPPFKGRVAYIMGDNDDAGRKYARTVAHALHAVAAAVYVIDPVSLWPELPNKGDISDICAAIGDKAAGAALEEAVKAAEPWEPEPGAEPERPAPAVTWEGEHLSCRNLEIYLELTGRDVKYDILSHKKVYIGFGGEETGAEDNDVPVHLLDELQALDQPMRLKGLTAGNIRDHLDALAHRPERRFNPVLDMIDAAEWDGADHLAEIYDLLRIDPGDTLSRSLLRKWLLQAYAQLHGTLAHPIQPETVLTLHGRQAAGKSRFFEMLAMGKTAPFYKEGGRFDPDRKDTVIENTAVFLCELGEVGGLMKRDRDALKAFLTSSVDTYRPPYKAAAERHPRLTSFCATVNDDRFLRDPTGSRRWAVIHIGGYLNTDAYDDFPALQLWAQIREIYRAEGEQCFRLTREELERMQERNREHAVFVPAEQEVADIIQGIFEEMDKDAAQGRECRYIVRPVTVTEWAKFFPALKRFDSATIGKALEVQGIRSFTFRDGGRVKRGRSLPMPRLDTLPAEMDA